MKHKLKFIKDYGRYNLFGVYNDKGQFLYTRCIQKIPTAKHNEKIIAAIEAKTKGTIELTDDEMQSNKRNYFKYIPQCTKDEVVRLFKKGISRANISAMVALDKSLIVKIIKEYENGGVANE